ncbi:MAG TPA: hypothetical protein VKE69_04490 [Planctomycetota bacterium]|nr:hypothetical protein [Planctomycetota bacterium]
MALRLRTSGLVLSTAAFALSSSASRADAQQVLVVAPAAGPGVFSTSIQSAIDAAGEGDTVLVRDGAYGGFLVFGKSITVCAEEGATAAIAGSMRVQNVGPSQRVVLRGLGVVGQTQGIALTDCAGALWIEDCTAVGAGDPDRDGLLAIHCASVTVLRCDLRGGDAPFGPFLSFAGGNGIRFIDSNFAVLDASLSGGDGGFFFPTQPIGASGGAGAIGFSGSLFASGTTFTGGTGGDFAQGTGGPGGHALSIGGSAVVRDCGFAPGAAGSGAIPGTRGSPTSVFGSGTVSTIPGAARHFDATSPVREQQLSTFTFGGVAGENAAVLFSLDPAPVASFPPSVFGGPVLVSLAAADAIAFGVVPGGGSLSAPVPFGSLPPSIAGLTLHFQSFYFDVPITYLVLGPASAVTILDANL